MLIKLIKKRSQLIKMETTDINDNNNDFEKNNKKKTNIYDTEPIQDLIPKYSKNYKLKYTTTHLDCEICSKHTGKQNLAEKFYTLSCDQETEDFIRDCHNTSYGYNLFKSFAKPILLKFYSLPDANGILGSGRMFMFSKNQLRLLFQDLVKNNNISSDIIFFNSLLDIGAGDGLVTDKFKEIVNNNNIICIETASKLIKALEKKGYKTKTDIEGEYELISLLNVLDRCEYPITIMKKIHQIKSKFIIVSIVLPFSGFYQEGTKKYPQKESFCEKYKNFEESVNVISVKFNELGFDVIRISRVPYLSEGNINREMFFLDTAVFILKNKE